MLWAPGELLDAAPQPSPDSAWLLGVPVEVQTRLKHMPVCATALSGMSEDLAVTFTSSLVGEYPKFPYQPHFQPWILCMSARTVAQPGLAHPGLGTWWVL